MNFGTALVLAIVVAIVALALWAVLKKKGACSCEDGCEACGSKNTCCSVEQAERLVAAFEAEAK